MFYSEQLLTKEGPLAHVWLAANLERKLTKQQLLSTDITETSEAIASSSSNGTNNQNEIEPLALRLTGTLLFGIVKIYSRKAKYLLDDVSEALLRLKTALRSSNSITLPPSATLIHSVKQVSLQDTVTANDLLWQEPLRFDDIDDEIREQDRLEELNDSFNTSIEMGRGGPLGVDELAGNDDDGLQLDFDLGDAGNHDMSIEVGRDLETAMADESVLPDLTFGLGENEEVNGKNMAEPDFGEFNDLGPGFEEEELQSPQTPQSPIAVGEIVGIPSPSQQERKKRPSKFTESDVVRTTKRRLVFDEITELTSAQIREQLQHSEGINLENGNDSDLSNQSLDERYQSLFKNSITTDFATNLLSIKPHMDAAENFDHNIEESFMGNLDLGQHNDLPNDNMNFSALEIGDEQELGGDGVEFDAFAEQILQQEDDPLQLPNTQQHNNDEIMQKITDFVQDERETTFSKVMENSSSEDIAFPKRHATTCFFDLLVMASSDKIKLKQQALFSEIEIVSCVS